eukprot:287326_1
MVSRASKLFMESTFKAPDPSEREGSFEEEKFEFSNIPGSIQAFRKLQKKIGNTPSAAVALTLIGFLIYSKRPKLGMEVLAEVIHSDFFESTQGKISMRLFETKILDEHLKHCPEAILKYFTHADLQQTEQAM